VLGHGTGNKTTDWLGSAVIWFQAFSRSPESTGHCAILAFTRWRLDGGLNSVCAFLLVSCITVNVTAFSALWLMISQAHPVLSVECTYTVSRYCRTSFRFLPHKTREFMSSMHITIRFKSLFFLSVWILHGGKVCFP